MYIILLLVSLEIFLAEKKYISHLIEAPLYYLLKNNRYQLLLKSDRGKNTHHPRMTLLPYIRLCQWHTFYN